MIWQENVDLQKAGRVVLVVSAVMAGLVPAIDTGTRQGWFGSRRDQKQSDGTRRPFACRVRAPKHVDGRAKPGHDVWGSSAGLSAGLRHTSVARARLSAAAVQRPCKYAQGTWFAFVCAAETVHGRGESEALSTGAVAPALRSMLAPQIRTGYVVTVGLRRRGEARLRRIRFAFDSGRLRRLRA